MTTCIVQYLSVRGQYPVIDVRRMAGPGPGPYRFGYNLAHVGIEIDGTRSASLPPCQMRVTLSTPLNEPKDILAWNLHANAQQDRIGSAGLGLQSSMLISSALAPGQACGQNTDTLVLRRKRPWPDGWTAFLPPGGLSKLPPPVPIDGTLLRVENDARVFLVVNGALSHVLGGAMERHCLPWRHVRIVPDTSLANLPTGPDIT